MYYEESKYVTFSKDFPICNHVKDIEANNLGYVQGVLDENIPFEAELWKNEKETVISFYFPNYEIGDEKSIRHKVNNVIGIRYGTQCKDYSVLSIGMVASGVEDDLDSIMFYVEILKASGLITFTSDMENGYVNYFIDIAGNNLVGVHITIEDENGVLAFSPLEFKSFLQDVYCFQKRRKCNNANKRKKVSRTSRAGKQEISDTSDA